MDKKIISFSINQLKDDILERYLTYINNNLLEDIIIDDKLISSFVSKLNLEDKKINKKDGLLDEEKMKEIEERFNKFKRKSKFLKEMMIELELRKL